MATDLVGAMDRIWPVALLDPSGREIACKYAVLYSLPYPGRGRQAWAVGVGDTPGGAQAEAVRDRGNTHDVWNEGQAIVRLQIFPWGMFIPDVQRTGNGTVRRVRGALFGADVLAAIGRAVSLAYPGLPADRLPVVIRREGKVKPKGNGRGRGRSFRLVEGD